PSPRASTGGARPATCRSRPSAAASRASPRSSPCPCPRRTASSGPSSSGRSRSACPTRSRPSSSGWTVTERERPAERVPLRARHVCLLFRRFRSFRTDVTHPYVRALEARHLPHLLVGGTSFHRREEVEAIRNALAAIERPEDELAVFATLRGPLFALGDAALLAFRERCRTLHSFRPLPADLP